MVKSLKKIQWDKVAAENLQSAISYIRRDSVKNSGKVKHDIILQAKSLFQHPEKYPLDKYKLNNDGTYRAFELHHYRITYRILQTEIRIINVRHTKMEPSEY